MKKHLLLILFFLCAASASAQSKADFLMAKMQSQSSDYVSVVAHRGDWRGAPENSLQAFRNCIKMGVDMIELDIKKTSDGVLVIMHDGNIDRTTNGTGAVSSHTYAELKDLYLKVEHAGWNTRHRIPTLEEVLNLCKDKILIQIDGAYPYFDDIIKLTKKTGTTNQVVLKFSEDPTKVKNEHGAALNKTLIMSLMSITAKSSVDYIASQAKLNPLMMECNFDKFNDYSQECLDLLKALDIKIMMNSIGFGYCDSHDDDRAVELGQPDEAWGFLIDKGAGVIQTDRPADLIAYLKARGLRNEEHNYVEGICQECGMALEDYKHPDADGFYDIASATDLLWLEALVERNMKNRVNARLTADIDLTSITFDGIGGKLMGATGSFCGIFDGQGHTIRGLKLTPSVDEAALFGALYGTLRNIKVVGSVTAKAKMTCLGGVVGLLDGGKVEHVESAVSLSTSSFLCSHVGGIIGAARNGAVVTNCTFSGTLTIGSSSDCLGGIIGYTNGSTIENCLASGRISANAGNTGNGIAGILGYCNTTNMIIRNCLFVGRNMAPKGAAIVGSMRAQQPRIYQNNYWKLSSAPKAYGSEAAMPQVADNSICVTTAQLVSGEVTVLLNSGQDEEHWYQDLGKDDYPVLDNTHQSVSIDAEGNYSNADAIRLPQADNEGQEAYDLSGRRMETRRNGIIIKASKKTIQ